MNQNDMNQRGFQSSSTATMQNPGQKSSVDEMDDDQIPPFLKNF